MFDTTLTFSVCSEDFLEEEKEFEEEAFNAALVAVAGAVFCTVITAY